MLSRTGTAKWGNLFIKVGLMNECSDQDLNDFDAIAHPNKVCFTAKSPLT